VANREQLEATIRTGMLFSLLEGGLAYCTRLPCGHIGFNLKQRGQPDRQTMHLCAGDAMAIAEILSLAPEQRTGLITIDEQGVSVELDFRPIDGATVEGAPLFRLSVKSAAAFHTYGVPDAIRAGLAGKLLELVAGKAAVC